MQFVMGLCPKSLVLTSPTKVFFFSNAFDLTMGKPSNAFSPPQMLWSFKWENQLTKKNEKTFSGPKKWGNLPSVGFKTKTEFDNYGLGLVHYYILIKVDFKKQLLRIEIC